jgi:D-psicose/D-tagatose/L-ribulose 3-epimerase
VRLAVSNIGWTEQHDASVLPKLRDVGVEAIEIALGRVFADPLSASVDDAHIVSERFQAAGLPIVSMQSLLYGRPELVLFGTQAEAEGMLSHLRQIMTLAQALGCGSLVFGSPKNRLRGDRSFDQACADAIPILRQIGDIAAKTNTTFCLEANASGYGCDFMTVLAEANQVAMKAAHPAIGQVLDTGNMMMEGEAPEAILPSLPMVRHVHISAPQLGPVAPHEDYVGHVISLLREHGYEGVVTLEMRPDDGPDPTARLLEAAVILRNAIDRG